ncbi:MAG: hypothetical protein KJ887_02690 [Candidatus Omnitrophica bacterium]|nr:hypothetical protein [Candidatus Omnitrophota bacterium]MBU1047675.1 hypothetical protein [Candidatus Omnitrophota bacterium]MBU1631508.1 hypothetical protein [Candidatus Omnitrophota bacterium]MBU1767331.1 hypothetical protein [Candidatus Omnitrophota bacterium]MBU1888595.1 hypothetical protein [Candidatus Omnitrophota bacterium]
MNRKNKSIVIFLIALLFFYACSYPLSQVQQRLRSILPEEATLKKLPPELVFTTVLLGGFRGILVNLLWLRAQQLQDDGKYFELVQLSDWIGLLQPYLPTVWIFNAWNLSYNISVKFPTGEERWNWIYQGIKLLRDKGLKYTPDSAEIYQELAWIQYHKISDTSDEFNAYYKRMLAKIMEDAFGDITLEEMVSNSSYEELLKDKSIETIISSFSANQIDILKDWNQISKDNFSVLPEKLRELTQNPSFPKIEAYLRGKRLREEFKMDPVFMLELEKKYFPLNWKSSAAHSLYWIEEGKRKATDMRELDYYRMVYFSLGHLWKWGNVSVKKINNEEVLILAPDFKVVHTLNAYYEDAIQQLEETGEPTTGIKSSQMYWLSEVVVMAYTMNDIQFAQKYYIYLRDKYPGEIANRSFPDYVASKFIEKLDFKETSIPNITDVLFGIMYQSYWALVAGEDERYADLQSLAKSVYERTARSVSRFQKLFPTFNALQKSSLESSLPMMPPAIASSLRTRLGIPEPSEAENQPETK